MNTPHDYNDLKGVTMEIRLLFEFMLGLNFCISNASNTQEKVIPCATYYLTAIKISIAMSRMMLNDPIYPKYL